MDKPRRSERLKGSTVFGPSKTTNAMLTNQKGMMLLPSSIQAIPAPNLTSQVEKPVLVLPEALDISENMENLRLYHAQLDFLSSLHHPDQADLDWQIEDVKDWTVRKQGDLELIFLLIS